jgi:hypothetical protein
LLLDNGYYYELGDALSTLQCQQFRAVVDQDDVDLSPIPGINQPGAIDDPNPEAGRQTTTRDHHSGVPNRDRHCDAGWHHRPRTRLESDVIARIEVNTSIAGMSVRWRR